MKHNGVAAATRVQKNVCALDTSERIAQVGAFVCKDILRQRLGNVCVEFTHIFPQDAYPKTDAEPFIDALR